ncbi:MAG: DUF4394 domain-containing protein [Gemmatimonadales bacterium]
MRYVRAGVVVLGLFALACEDGTSPTSETTGLEGAGPAPELSEQGQGGEDRYGGNRRGRVYGVDAESYLVLFSLDRPGEIKRRVRISGTGGEKVVGIDFRPSAVAPADPANIGKLYGITKTTIYQIDPRTGAASNGQPLTVPLKGAFFGTGFNPVVDRWRNHGVTEQNLRLNVDLGLTISDTSLAYEPGDRNFGKDPSVAGTAYTNSDNDPATGTTLYAIDAKHDVLVVLNVPNNGKLTTVGRLRVRTNKFVGFDIPGELQTGKRFGYASLTTPDDRHDKWYWGGSRGRGGSTLYKVDLDTGAARRVGAIGNRSPLVSIALAP